MLPRAGGGACFERAIPIVVCDAWRHGKLLRSYVVSTTPRLRRLLRQTGLLWRQRQVWWLDWWRLLALLLRSVRHVRIVVCAVIAHVIAFFIKRSTSLPYKVPFLPPRVPFFCGPFPCRCIRPFFFGPFFCGPRCLYHMFPSLVKLRSAWRIVPPRDCGVVLRPVFFTPGRFSPLASEAHVAVPMGADARDCGVFRASEKLPVFLFRHG